jgi:hypothetical protein
MACEVHVELCFIRIWRLGHVYLDAVRGAWRKLAPHHCVLYYLDAFEQRPNVFLGLLYVRPPLSSASRYVRPMPYLSRICSSPQWQRQLRAKDSSRFSSPQVVTFCCRSSSAQCHLPPLAISRTRRCRRTSKKPRSSWVLPVGGEVPCCCTGA